MGKKPSTRSPLSRFRRAVYAANAFLLLILIVAVPVAFDQWNLRWAAPLAVFFLVLTLCTLNLRSDVAAKVFERLKLDLLIPSLREVINHNKRLEQCRTVVKKMEYTLGFYNLWELLEPPERDSAQRSSPSTRKRQKLRDRLITWRVRLRERLRWEKLNDLVQSDPDVRRPILPAELAQMLIGVDDKEKRVARCAEEVAKHIENRLRETGAQVFEETESSHYETLVAEAGTTLRKLETRAWSPLLRLLYQEHHGPASRDLWDDMKQKEELISGLTAVLLWSNRLPRPAEDLPYETSRLENMVGNLEDFSLGQTRAKVLADQKRRYENRSLVEQMEHTVRFFDLGTLEPAFWDELRLSLRGNRIEERRKDCARRTAARLRVSKPFVSSDRLDLLYLERHESWQKARTLWNDKKQEEGFVSALAEILLESKRLPSVEEDLPLEADRLAALMAPLDEFTLDTVRNTVLADQEHRRANRYVVDGVISTLGHYNLYPLLAEDALSTSDRDGRHTKHRDFRHELIDSFCVPIDEDKKPEYYAGRIVERIQLSKLIDFVEGGIANGELPVGDAKIVQSLKDIDASVISNLLLLLYREDHKQALGDLWKENALESVFILGLASLLVYGDVLPHGEGHLPYGIRDLKCILTSLSSFTLARTKTELDELSEIWRIAQRYLTFLEENGIAGWKLQVAAMLEQVNLPVDDHRLDRQIRNILVWIGESAITEAFRELPDVLDGGTGEEIGLVTRDLRSREGELLAHSLSLVSLAIFITKRLTERLSLREPVCRMAAEDRKALLIVFGYLEFREHLRSEDKIGGREFVGVDHLALNWPDRAKERQDKLGRGFWEEIEAIRDILRDGGWLQRLPVMLEKAYKRILEQNWGLNQKLDQLLKARPEIRKLLEAVFKGLKVHTVERYLEARVHTAYLLHFRVEKGTLAYLLDCLVSNDPGKRSILQKIGIKLLANDQPKYNFRQYTPNTRVGVIPQRWTFDRFYAELQEDFRKLYAAREQLLPRSKLRRNLDDIEVIVSRFGLSGQNYRELVMEGLTRPKAIVQIGGLLSEILKSYELSTVIEYEEENLVDAVMNLPIKELVAGQVKSNEVERQALEREDQRLKEGLISALGCIDLWELSRALYINAAGEKQKAKPVLASLMARVPELKNPNRRERFADIYVETLAAVASLVA